MGAARGCRQGWRLRPTAAGLCGCDARLGPGGGSVPVLGRTRRLREKAFLEIGGDPSVRVAFALLMTDKSCKRVRTAELHFYS